MKDEQFQKDLQKLNLLMRPSILNMFLFIKENIVCRNPDIQKYFNIEQSTCSNRVNSLIKSGLVNSSRQGIKIYYSIDRKATKDLFDSLKRQICNG